MPGPGSQPVAPKTRSELLEAVDALPPLPAIAVRVMQVAHDPRSSAADLAIVVQADPGLSARVLRIANSAAYRRLVPITSIQHALVVLGFVEARNVAVSSALASAYAPSAPGALFRMDAFWRHSLAVAFQGSKLARAFQVDQASVFTAGILHDIGRLAMFYADPAGLDQTVAQAIAHDLPLEEAERELLGYDASELGGMLAEKWNLPADIRDAIAGATARAVTPHSLAGVVGLADRWVRDHGILPGYVIPPPANAPARPDALVDLLVQVDGLMQLISGRPTPIRRRPIASGE
jgi:putative nucleotidyltransferase with HDIG domain